MLTLLTRSLLRGLVLIASAVSLSACAQQKDPTMKDLAQLPDNAQSIVLGMGCFWGAEKRMGELPGVLRVESGYANGDAPDTDYQSVLALERAIQSGQTTQRNHAEVVRVFFDPAQIGLHQVLAAFWENHDPTQKNRQGNDVGTNYRSAIYTLNDTQQNTALETRSHYQKALDQAGKGPIQTEVAPLENFTRAEEYHQDYLQKNPNGYCGLGGTGVAYPNQASGDRTELKDTAATSPQPLQGDQLNQSKQLVVFESEHCGFCDQFKQDVLSDWQSPVAVTTTRATQAPTGWTLEKPLFATPTMVLFKSGQEVARYTGYQGDTQRFWEWLGFHILSPEQQRIAFEQGTERPFTGSHLDEKRAGTFVDPITGEALFRTDTKFDSGSGWPSFFNPVPGAITEHPDDSHGMQRIEVRSASSGIHLGHVFNDGPPPTGKRYCINGNVLRFVPDEDAKAP